MIILSWHVGDKMLEISWQDRWPAIQGRKLWASSLGISSASSQRKWKHELSIVVNFDIDNGNVKGEWILSTMFWQTMLAILSWYCHKNHENHHDNVGDKESETTIVKKPPNVDSSCSSVWPRIICDVAQWVVVVNVRSLIDNVGSCFSSVWWPRIIYHVVQWFMVVRWWWQFCQFLFSGVSPWTVGSQSPPCCPVSPSQPG